MSQNKSVEEVVDIAIANLMFSGLSIAQMDKIPKWLLENIDKNKSDFKETLRQTSQEREREIVVEIESSLKKSSGSKSEIDGIFFTAYSKITNPNKD